MTAIPTMYAGVQFRSRLEAKWAAMFDLLEWPWEYEPIDLEGYIPDFILYGKLLVEVKPLLWSVSREPEAIEVAKKIDIGGWTGCSVLLGARFIDNSVRENCDTYIRIGLMRQPLAPGDRWDAFTGNSPYDGVDYLKPFGCEVFSKWREAGNCTQWRAPGPVTDELARVRLQRDRALHVIERVTSERRAQLQRLATAGPDYGVSPDALARAFAAIDQSRPR